MTIRTRSTTQNAFEATARLNWEIDAFGRIRAAYASSLAQAGATSADARGVRLGLTADPASGYFGLRTADEQVAILDETVGQRHEMENNLALLCGQPAPDFHVNARSVRPDPALSQPRRVSALLLTRRPDVAASERRLAAALQDIREARAEERPRVTATGYVGQMSENIEHFADRKSHEAAVMPVISIPVFEGGRSENQAVDDARAVLGFPTDRYDHQTASCFQVVTDQAPLLSTRLNAARPRRSRRTSHVIEFPESTHADQSRRVGKNGRPGGSRFDGMPEAVREHHHPTPDGFRHLGSRRGTGEFTFVSKADWAQPALKSRMNLSCCVIDSPRSARRNPPRARAQAARQPLRFHLG